MVTSRFSFLCEDTNDRHNNCEVGGFMTISSFIVVDIVVVVIVVVLLLLLDKIFNVFWYTERVNDWCH